MSMAMKYAMKKRAKMYDGGQVPDPKPSPESSKADETTKSMRKAFHFKNGGDVDCPGCEMCHGGDMMAKGGKVEKQDSMDYSIGHHQPYTKGDEGESLAGSYVREGKMEHAKDRHKDILGSMRGMKKGSEKNLAHGGEVGSDDDDLVMKIMKKRYSMGGEVANDTPPLADGEENDFDELALKDDLEFSDTSKNSGDELGDGQEDDDRHDMVKRIMKSRGKKDKMPRPA